MTGGSADNTPHDNTLHAIFYELQRRKAIKGFAGGERLVAPLEYATNATVDSIAKAGKINLVEQDIITSAEFNWKLIAGAVVLFEFDLRRNRGEHQMVSLVETKAKNAISSMREEMLNQMFATSQAALDLLNWQSIFRDTGTIGGINPTTYAWWKAKYDNTAEPLTIEDMFDMYNQSSGGSDPPKVLISGRTLN